MRPSELLTFLAVLVLGLGLCCRVLFWDWGSGDPWYLFWALVPIVGGLVYVAVVSRVLRKQGVAVWCAAHSSVTGRRRFHRFEDTGEKDRWNIFECSVCGVRREIVVSEGDGGMGE